MSDHPTTYHAQQSGNIARSMLMLSAMVMLLVAVVTVMGYSVGLSGPVVAVVAAVFAVAAPTLAWYRSDSLVLTMTRAREVGPLENPQLHNLVEEVALAAALPKPRVYVVDDPAPNAFATGRNPERGVVAFTTGLLEKMNRAELEGVVAHELAHIRNRDTTVAAVAAATAGALAIVSDLSLRFTIFGGRNKSAPHPAVIVLAIALALLAPIAGLALQAAVSRRREALADATAVEFTRNPAGLRAALEKLAGDSTVVRTKSRAAAHVWLESPLTTRGIDRLFSTHPPLADRIAALALLEGYRAPSTDPGRQPAVSRDWNYPAPPH